MAAAATERKTNRMTGEERREQVLGAAREEFAVNGYYAASTSRIAKRAGISQPYIYALFPDKRTLFLQVYADVVAAIAARFDDAVEGVEGIEDRLAAMGAAYTALLEDRTLLRCQLQAQAAAAGDEDLRREVQEGFSGLWARVERLSGADHERVRTFFANGMLCNVQAALDLPELAEDFD